MSVMRSKRRVIDRHAGLRRRLGRSGWCLAALAAAGALSPPCAAQGPEPLRQRYVVALEKKAALEREKHLRTLQAQMAEKDDPWLLIDLADRQLHIFVRATSVKAVPFTTLGVEGERHLLGTSPPPDAWADGALELSGKSGPQKEPEKVQPKDPATAGAPVDPATLTPEKLGIDKDPDYPDRYTLLFRQGVAVSLGGATSLTEDQKGWIRRAWDKVRTAVSGPEMPRGSEMVPVRVWVYLEIDPKEAKQLYPSLYTGMRTIVRLPGDPAL
jgi:hypothetical protein